MQCPNNKKSCELRQLQVYICQWGKEDWDLDVMARTGKCRTWCAKKYPRYAAASLTEPQSGCGGDYCELHMSKAHENIDTRYYLSDDTEVKGKKWKELKIKAMTASYEDEFNSLSHKNKQMIRYLI